MPSLLKAKLLECSKELSLSNRVFGAWKMQAFTLFSIGVDVFSFGFWQDETSNVDLKKIWRNFKLFFAENLNLSAELTLLNESFICDDRLSACCHPVAIDRLGIYWRLTDAFCHGDFLVANRGMNSRSKLSSLPYEKCRASVTQRYCVYVLGIALP